MGRRQPRDLGPDLLVRLEPQALAEVRRQIGGDDPIGARRARRGDLLRQRADAPFEVGEGARHLGRAGCRENDIRMRDRRVDEQVDRDQPVDPLERPLGEIAVGEVAQRVGTEQHEGRDAAIGRGLENAAGSRGLVARQLLPFVA
jgi:hypothetical protein